MVPSFDAEKKISKLVNFMLQVQYDYTGIITDLKKDEPTEMGVRKYVKKMIKTIQSDVQTLIKIQENMEGTIVFEDLDAPNTSDFDSVLEVLHEVLEKEKKINKKLAELHSWLLRNFDQTPIDAEEIVEMVQWRDHVIQQIVEHIVHLEQNQGTVGEFTVSRMMEEEHCRLRQIELEEQQLKRQSLLPTTPEQQRKQLSSRSSSSIKRTILSPKRLQPTLRSEKLIKMKKF